MNIEQQNADAHTQATPEAQHVDPALERSGLSPPDPVPSADGGQEPPREQRIRRVLLGAIVVHPRMGWLLNEVHWMVQEPQRERARGYIICGEPGNGKTTIATILKRQYPIDGQNMRAGNDRSCTISIDLAGARTTKTVLTRILDCIGCPHSKGSISYLEQLVHDVLRRMNCRLLILDEAQDVLQGRPTEQLRVVETIKHMMNRLCLPILLLGTKAAASALSVDPHMQARFECGELPIWSSGNDLSEFLKRFEKTLGLRKPSNLHEAAVMKVLVDSSKGVLAGMLSQLKWAAVNAIIDGTERITIESLGQKVEKPNVQVLMGKAA